MTDVLHDFGLFRGPNGITYHVRACGSELDETVWQGWLEFEPIGTSLPTLRSPRETTQPNRTDTVYWATGLTPVYLEGALDRALNPQLPPPAPYPSSVLNPFSVYQKGETLLRDQLHALAPWHLVNIIIAHDLSNISPDDLQLMSAAELVELIVTNVRIAVGETRLANRNPPVPTET